MLTKSNIDINGFIVKAVNAFTSDTITINTIL